jgi:choice-of-anchor C domain-containing protein
MTRNLVPTLAAAVTASLLAAGASAAGNLVVNGSFEQGTNPGQFMNVPAGSNAITGWTVGDFHVDYCSSSAWYASDGVRSVDLDGSVLQPPRNGSISQAFATTPGQSYRVSFDLAGNITGLPLLKQVEVSAGDALQVFTYDSGAIVPFVPPLALDYQHETMTFTALASTTTLEFRSLTPLSGSVPGWGAVIDDVVVELATWTDLGFALAGQTGAPELAGTGELVAGSAGTLVLTAAAPSAPALLFVALASVPVPFKGGTLLPVPTLLTLPLVTSPVGGIPLGWGAWPAGLSGSSLWFQYGVQDAGAPVGVALSNGLRADVP